MIEKLDWDSNFFGFNVGKTLNVTENFLRNFLESDFHLVYYFLDSMPYSFPSFSSEFIDFEFVDIKIIFSKRILETTYKIEHVYEYANEDDLVPSLVELALESGRFSRFKIDNNFEPETFAKFYSTWLLNSLNKKIADHVLIYKSEGKVKGFLTLKLSKEKAIIGLISVDKEYRGENVGSTLMKAAENVAFKSGIYLLEVATQFENLQACNFYIKNNFRIQEQIKIFHIWKKIK